VARLGARYVEVANLRFALGCSIADIAAELG
jgi:hypothetical protein